MYLLSQSITKKCICDSAFGSAAPRLWNELPVNIRSSGTLSMFRKCLNTHLFILHFNSNCFEMTDIALKLSFSTIHVLISVYVLD